MHVVADTNIIVSGLLWYGSPRQVLDAARTGVITLATSAPRLAELADVLQLKANHRDGVPTSPKVLAGAVAIATAELTGNGNRTLALEETDDRGHRVLRRYLDAHMNVIRHHMPFNNPALFLTRQFMEDRT